MNVDGWKFSVSNSCCNGLAIYFIGRSNFIKFFTLFLLRCFLQLLQVFRFPLHLNFVKFLCFQFYGATVLSISFGVSLEPRRSFKRCHQECNTTIWQIHDNSQHFAFYMANCCVFKTILQMNGSIILFLSETSSTINWTWMFFGGVASAAFRYWISLLVSRLQF